MSRGEPVERGGLRSVPTGPVHDLMPGRVADLGGGTPVQRLLPTLGRRMVGAWCFLDHYGPDVAGSMDVWPHPHTGLQTVSWLLEGQVRHEDSLGSDAVLVPGTLGLMTAGRGIAHAETTSTPALLHGTQLWTALPDSARDIEPTWDLHARQPRASAPGAEISVILGAYDGAASAGRTFWPVVGLDVVVSGATSLVVEPEFEHAAAIVGGAVDVDGVALPAGSLLYLGTGRSALVLRGSGRILLLGGAPFDERIVMWWNLIARSHEEIVETRRQWEERDGFADVPGWTRRTPAPDIDVRLRPR